MSTDTCTTSACEMSAHDHSEDTATRQKAAVVVLSDPKSGSQEEALGRVFNALAAAYDFKQRGDDVLSRDRMNDWWVKDVVFKGHALTVTYRKYDARAFEYVGLSHKRGCLFKVRHTNAKDGNERIAGILAGMQADGMPADYIVHRNDRVAAVTVEDVRRVAARLLRPDGLHFVVVGQPEGLEPGD